MLALVLSFFLTAILYASAGLGGGSAYLPLLVLGNVDERLIPAIALLCNLIVVSGGLLSFARNGHLDWRFSFPFVLFSIPFAWIGGQLAVDRETFRLVLGLVLILTAVALYYTSNDNRALGDEEGSKWGRWIGLPVGSALGFLSGLTGIGGGVFLAPILHALRLASPQMIAATCSLFIFVNSSAGLASHLTRLVDMGLAQQLNDYAFLFLAVLIGGLAGNFLNIAKLSREAIQRITSIILIVAGGRLLYDWYMM